MFSCIKFNAGAMGFADFARRNKTKSIESLNSPKNHHLPNGGLNNVWLNGISLNCLKFCD